MQRLQHVLAIYILYLDRHIEENPPGFLPGLMV